MEILDKQLKLTPKNTIFCSKCVVSNQRPRITFDDNNICSACNYAETKKNVIDWKERESILKDLLNKHRSKDGSYDVIVPGSGGKDSSFVAHQLKHKYNMNPITVTFAPYIYTEWGWKNMECWSHAGFENYLNTPNQKVYRLLTRIALENFFHPWHPWTVGHKVFPVKFAKNFNVPLVIYGDSPGEYGQNEYNADYNIEWHTCEKKRGRFIFR